MKPYHDIPADIPAKTPPHGDQLIPRAIMQTFSSNSVPRGMYNAAMSWIDRNPDYSYHFYSDERCREFISSHFDADVLAAFDKVKTGAFKADLWRYCALFVSGGVYTDLDTVCAGPLNRLIRENERFISVFAGAVRGGIFNAFICSVPGHPFMERAIRKSVWNIHNNGSGCRHVLELTGPLCLGDAINELTNRPAGADFSARQYTLNGYTFRILEKVRAAVPSERKVVNGNDTVLLCKYEGYGEDLQDAGKTHWSGRNE